MTRTHPTKLIKNPPVVLTDSKIRTIKPRDKAYKVFDAACTGLYLAITPQGSKLWRMRYWRDKRECVASFGKYPAVSLGRARERVLEVRTQLAEGLDPHEQCRLNRVAAASKSITFGEIATEWVKKKAQTWAPGYADVVSNRIGRDLLPWLKDRPIGDIDSLELLSVVQRAEGRGVVFTAHRTLGYAGSIFRYAVATRRAQTDPTWPLRGAIAPVRHKHLAAITDPAEVGHLLRAIDEFRGAFVTKCALRLLPYVFTRPGELRHAEWIEIDFETRLWRIPSEKMKKRVQHVVPLSTQAVAILREIQPLTGHGHYVFPGLSTPMRPISDTAINLGLRRIGYSKDEMTCHGFRSTASSLLNELGFHPDLIELQLAHRDRNQVRATYNRSERLAERAKMMQAWADYLDSLRAGGQAIVT